MRTRTLDEIRSSAEAVIEHYEESHNPSHTDDDLDRLACCVRDLCALLDQPAAAPAPARWPAPDCSAEPVAAAETAARQWPRLNVPYLFFSLDAYPVGSLPVLGGHEPPRYHVTVYLPFKVPATGYSSVDSRHHPTESEALAYVTERLRELSLLEGQPVPEFAKAMREESSNAEAEADLEAMLDEMDHAREETAAEAAPAPGGAA